MAKFFRGGIRLESLVAAIEQAKIGDVLPLGPKGPGPEVA